MTTRPIVSIVIAVAVFAVCFVAYVFISAATTPLDGSGFPILPLTSGQTTDQAIQLGKAIFVMILVAVAAAAIYLVSSGRKVAR